ncbi:MAG: aminotransferase class III-fold pyridoxal phosphate-dependent enzyme, partial [Candidatus Limnocylindrales bacterium]
WDVTPDIFVIAKGMASGLPLSGIIAQRSLLDAFPPGTHGGTFGGNVVACAAANATLDVIEEEGLADNARERGRQALAGLRAFQPRHASVGDVRGLGLMLALEFVRPGVGDGRIPNPELAKRVIAAALERKLIVLSAGTYGQVVRIIPPLVTTGAEVDLAIGILGESLEAAGA